MEFNYIQKIKKGHHKLFLLDDELSEKLTWLWLQVEYKNWTRVPWSWEGVGGSQECLELSRELQGAKSALDLEERKRAPKMSWFLKRDGGRWKCLESWREMEGPRWAFESWSVIGVGYTKLWVPFRRSQEGEMMTEHIFILAGLLAHEYFRADIYGRRAADIYEQLPCCEDQSHGILVSYNYWKVGVHALFCMTSMCLMSICVR